MDSAAGHQLPAAVGNLRAAAGNVLAAAGNLSAAAVKVATCLHVQEHEAHMQTTFSAALLTCSASLQTFWAALQTFFVALQPLRQVWDESSAKVPIGSLSSLIPLGVPESPSSPDAGAHSRKEAYSRDLPETFRAAARRLLPAARA